MNPGHLHAMLLLILMKGPSLQSSVKIEGLSFIKSKLSYRTNILGGQRTASSPLDCLSHCLSSFKDACQSFMYNRVTLQCTPGASIDDGLYNATDSETKLHVMSKAFSIQGNFSSRFCLAYFPGPINYWDARDICRISNAYLYVPRSNESYDAFKSVSNLTEMTWVGLTYTGVSGVYIAEDNGQDFNISSIQSLFAPKQPDAPYHQFLLDDQFCNNTYAFVCQKTC